MSIEEREIEGLQLPTDQRAKLAELLIASLDEDEEIQRAWMQEAERRLAEIDSGKVVTRPAAEVFAEARARLA